VWSGEVPRLGRFRTSRSRALPEMGRMRRDWLVWAGQDPWTEGSWTGDQQVWGQVVSISRETSTARLAASHTGHRPAPRSRIWLS